MPDTNAGSTSAQGSPAGLTDAQHDWATRFCGMNTRSAKPSATPIAAPSPPAAKPDAKLLTARRTWLATRARVEGDIAKLQAKVAAVYSGHDEAADLEDAFVKRVEPVLHALDDRLAHKLDELAKATGPERAKLVAEAREIITSYERYLDGNDVIEHLDRNPLVPLAIRTVLENSLDGISGALS